MEPFVTTMRAGGYRVLPYIDDFLFLVILSEYRRVATPEDCAVARVRIEDLMEELGLNRHHDKGEWVGSQVVQHLGLVVDTRKFRFSLLRCAREGLQSAAGGWEASPTRHAPEALGYRQAGEVVLRFVCVAHVGNPVGALLHAITVLGHGGG